MIIQHVWGGEPHGMLGNGDWFCNQPSSWRQSPSKNALTLAFESAKPVEAGLHRIRLLLEYGVFDHAIDSGVVSLDRGGRL